MNIGVFVFIDLDYNPILSEEIDNKAIYKWMIEKCGLLNEKIIILTTTDERNQELLDFAAQNSIDVYIGRKELIEVEFDSYVYGITPKNGMEDGVMQFYIEAAQKYNIDTIIKINGGSLFFDIGSTKGMLDFHIKQGYEYTEISERHYFLQGIFPEIVNLETLMKFANREGVFKYRRGNVLNFIAKHQTKSVRKGYFALNDESLKKTFVNLYIDFKWKLDFIRRILAGKKLDLTMFDAHYALERLDDYFSFPRHIIVEPTRKCLLNCYMCPRRELEAQNGELTFEMFVDIVEQVKDKSTVIEFSGFGEPMLNNSLPEMVAYAKSKGLKTVVYSALTANIKFIKKVIDAGLDLLLANLLNFDPKLSLKLYNAENYLAVYHNLNKLFGLRKEKKFNLGVTTVLHGGNKSSIMKLYNVISTQADVVSVKNMFDFFGKIEGYKSDDFTPNKRMPCKKLLNQLFVEFDGRTNMCYYRVFDEKAKNSLQDYSIEQIWNNSVLSQNRNAQLNYDFDKDSYCKKCKEWYNA